MRNLTEIRLSGFGGQGVILSAITIGKAGCIYESGYSTMTQAFVLKRAEALAARRSSSPP